MTWSSRPENSSTLIDDLEENFASLREYRWKLNPNKCVFGVPSGKLLGFIISQRGIEANPEKISVLMDKIRIPLRSASVQTPHLFHHGIPKVLVNPRSKGITSVRSTTTH
jgi:hypothetical protein